MTQLAYNKKAGFDYEILERFEAGIELFGYEVKAVRAKHASLEGAHVTVRGGEAFLIGASISPLQPKNAPDGFDDRRNRKLLLNKKEIAELASRSEQRGLTIVPISMYNKGRTVKAEIAVVRGKKEFDKRETMKKRESDRDVFRDLKGGR